MVINVIEKINCIIIEIKGDIVGGPGTDEFQSILKGLAEKGIVNIIVDLSGVKYMNSTGVGILVRGYTTIKTAGGRLKFAAVNDKINVVLSITQLSKVIEIYPTVEDAIESFQVKAF